MTLMKVFWIFVAFYAVVKVGFFIGVYFVTKAVERRALAEKTRQAQKQTQISELESVVALYERKLRLVGSEKDSKEETPKRFAV